jgi:hypothetical protein
MKWQRTIKRLEALSTDEGHEDDPFLKLAADKGSARVSGTISRSLEYGELKCGVTVTISCPQSDPHINIAAGICLRKAIELVNGGMKIMGIKITPLSGAEPEESSPTRRTAARNRKRSVA